MFSFLNVEESRASADFCDVDNSTPTPTTSTRTMVGPSLNFFLWWSRRLTWLSRFPAEYFADIAKAYRAELADLYEAGCRNVQFDDPILAYFVRSGFFLCARRIDNVRVVLNSPSSQCSQSMLAGMKAEGIDSDAMFDSYIKLYNDCLEGRPADMTVGVHLCRGNFSTALPFSPPSRFVRLRSDPLFAAKLENGMHFSEGGYDAISSKLFKNLVRPFPLPLRSLLSCRVRVALTFSFLSCFFFPALLCRTRIPSTSSTTRSVPEASRCVPPLAPQSLPR